MEEKKASGVKNVEIFVRVLPLVTTCESCLKIDDNKKDIYVRCLQDIKRDKTAKSNSPVYWRFQTDRVFLNSSQEEVYEGVTKDLLQNILDGANCVLISYGQTGTGKSFTISGLWSSYEHRGIIARLLSDMFEEKRKRKYSSNIEYRLSYVEMYRNQVNDLLVGKKEPKKFNIRDALKRVTSVPLKSEDETLRKIFEGEARKVIEPGATCDASHLGTSILTFHISNTSLITSWAVAARSKIHIVDMAGVDSVGKTSSRKSAEKISNANLDKAQMEQFIIDLQSQKRSKINSYRSNLLKYLGTTFSLGSILRFIAHVRATNEDLVLTLSILRFGSNVKKLKPKKIHYEISPESNMDVQKLQKDITALKEELEINEMLLNQETSTSISSSRAKQIERDAIDFINGSLDELMLLSVSQAQILLKTFRNMFAKLKEDHKLALEQAARDAYDSATKDLKGSTLSVTKSSKTAVTGSNGKMRRKKSAVERLSETTSQPLLDEDETAKNKVGELVNTGISIGPGKSGPGFGPVVRLIKIRKNGEPPSRTTVVVCSDSPEPEKTTKVMDRDDAFQCYLEEDEDASTMKKELDETVAARETGQEFLRDLISKHKEMKTEMESARVELHKQQNIRHLMGNEVYDDEARVIIPELEKRLCNVVTSLEKDLSNMQCRVVEANDELRQLVENEISADRKLESGFEIFCEKIYNRVVPNLEEDKSREETYVAESVDSFERTKSNFTAMQRMMKLMIENKPEPRKEWCSHIGNFKK